MPVLSIVAVLLAIVLAGAPAADVEQRNSTAALPPHVAAAFDEIAACHLSTAGDYLLFDRRAHAVYSVAAGADVAQKIVQIGSETGRILRPSAFDSAPDGTF